jgi:superfamily I DNA/RNA helicase
MDATWWINQSQLDAEQRKVVALPRAGNHLVLGPPGSGKTNLLLLRGKFVALAGSPNIVVLTFTRSLARFIKMGASQYSFGSDRIKTVMDWTVSTLRELGGSVVNLPDDFEGRRKEAANRLAEQIDKTNAHHIFDSILVDEIQDCSPQEVELFSRLGKTLFFVGDASQQIYSGEDLISGLRSRMNLTVLTYHYRCGKPICVVADTIAATTAGLAQIAATCNYKDSAMASVNWVQSPDLSTQNNELISRLGTQLRAYPDELIAVACPKREEVERVRTLLDQSSLSGSVDYFGDDAGFDALGAQSGRRLIVSTLHGLKGLEFRAVILVGLEAIGAVGRQRQKKLGYTAVTRARTSLTFFSIGRIEGWLEKAIRAGEPPPPEPTLGDLF